MLLNHNLVSSIELNSVVGNGPRYSIVILTTTDKFTLVNNSKSKIRTYTSIDRAVLGMQEIGYVGNFSIVFK